MIENYPKSASRLALIDGEYIRVLFSLDIDN